jgi:hypothetical protein
MSRLGIFPKIQRTSTHGFEYVSIAIHSLTFDAMRTPSLGNNMNLFIHSHAIFFLPCGNSTVRDLEKHHVYILGPGKLSN